VDELTKRLDTLERRNRWLTRTVLLMGLALVGLVAVGWTSPDGTVEAAKFIVKDKGGNVRTVLGVDPNGSPCLVLYDTNGKGRIAMGVDPNGAPAIVFADADGNATWSAPK